MHTTVRRIGPNAGLALTLAATLVAGGGMAPRAAVADTGSTNTIKVLNAPTILPPATGGSFTVDIVANGATTISGAGSGLSFDQTKLQVTSLAKDTTEVANGVTYIGYPSSGSLATFLSTANASGQIPNISWTYLDGSSSETANADHGIFSVTFQVTALGDSTISPASTPVILDGVVATYGNALLPLATTSGTVVNTAAVAATPSITALPAALASNSLPVAWSATPGSAAIGNYDVRYRKAAYNGTFGGYTPWLTATAASSGAFSTTPGTTYCFSVLARDINGLASDWTADTCTAAPLDDRSLVRAGAWSAKAGAGYYRNTWVQATAAGAKLTRTGVKAKRLSLVASVCPTCGSVQVLMGTKILKTISLKSAAIVNRKIIAVYTFPTVTTGTLTIKVVTSGKKVVIDGVVISAV